jgi:ABC-type Fe3+/spermidine/putrescine transport system ATPase subunit
VSALLSIRTVVKGFGNRAVLRGITLDIDSGEFLTILGESGSGKTTLLRLIAGFERPDSGEIWMADERIDELAPYNRHVNTVFQSYALFPHLSVFENIAYGPRVQSTPKLEIPKRVEQALAMVKMSDYAQSSPSRLSGGQQQRVALARALVNRPKVLLLDEPLSALDANLRRQMQTELKSLQREVGITFIFVTHDQEEAMALSDRIALLRAGTLEQVASPREIYATPATAYTAQFIGQTNLLKAQIRNGFASSSGMTWQAAASQVAPASLPASDDGPAKSNPQSRTEANSPSNATFSPPRMYPSCRYVIERRQQRSPLRRPSNKPNLRRRNGSSRTNPIRRPHPKSPNPQPRYNRRPYSIRILAARRHASKRLGAKLRCTPAPTNPPSPSRRYSG